MDKKLIFKDMEDAMKKFIDGLYVIYPEAKKQLEKDMKGTPKRFTETIREMFRGYALDEDCLKQLLQPVYLSHYNGMVVQKNIVSFSVCPHHLLPIKYSFAIGYIPDNKKAIGLSKLAHLCGYFAVRPHLQETLTYNIVESLEKYLAPLGCGVVVIGRHDCISLGAGETHGPEVKALNATTRDNVYNITAELRGKFREDSKIEDIGAFKNARGQDVRLELSRSEARKLWMELQDVSLR